MKGMKLRKVFTLLCLVMLLSVLPMAALATEGECAHEVGQAATCKDQALCKFCSQPFGELAAHVAGQAATCKEQAICKNCNKPFGELAAHVAGQAATCKEQAICKNCNQHYGDFAPHVAGLAATCEDKAICKNCNKEYGTSLGHTEKTEATCTTAAVCATCNKPYGTSLGHKYGDNGLCIRCGAPAGEFRVSLSASKFTYDGTAHKPAVTLKAGDVTVAASYYSVSYSNNVNAGTATVRVEGKNGLGFIIDKEFTIEKAALTVGPAGYSMTQNDTYQGVWMHYSGLCGSDKVTVSPTPVLKVYAPDGSIADFSNPVHCMGKYTIVWENAKGAAINNNNYKLVIEETATLNVIATRADFTISGIKTYATVDGYAVNLHKFSDENVEKILDNPGKDGTIELKFKPESYINYLNTVRIPVELIEEIAEAANDAKSDVKALEVTLPNGRSLKLDAKALDDLAEKAEGKFAAIIMVKSGDVKTSEAEELTKAQKKDLSDRPAYVFAIASGKGMVEDLAGELTMKIPYKTRYKETEAGLKVSLIDEDGKRTACETSYDEDTDKVVWKGKGLAFYVIEHEAKK